MESKMDIVKVENTLVKLKAYMTQEVNNLEKIKMYLDKMSASYSSDNKIINNDKTDVIINKFNIIKRIHNNNNIVIRKNIKIYTDTSRLLASKIKNIQ